MIETLSTYAASPARLSSDARVARELRYEGAAKTAIALFLAHGYDNVSMDEIAIAAGLSRRTLFRRFRQKEEFLILWTQQFNQELCDAILRQPAATEPLQAVQLALYEITDISLASADTIWTVHQISAGTATVRAALLRAERDWERAIKHSLIALYAEDAARWSEKALGLAAALGYVGLRLAIAEWTALPRS